MEMSEIDTDTDSEPDTDVSATFTPVNANDSGMYSGTTPSQYLIHTPFTNGKQCKILVVLATGAGRW